jgi:solute carrier family 35, member E3
LQPVHHCLQSKRIFVRSGRKMRSQHTDFHAACLLTNFFSACAIVFANKLVLSTFRFRFAIALTCIHTIATWLAAKTLSHAGFIKPKVLPRRAVASLASAFTGYIVLCNVSLALNTVGFYQITKIATAPTVLLMESITQRRAPKPHICACVAVICAGIWLATVSGSVVSTNTIGMIVGFASVVVSAQYGVWIGGMTKQYDIDALQLLEQYLPYAAIMMLACVPAESIIMRRLDEHAATLLTFSYDRRSALLIALSALLGILVTFSTFLVIDCTSPLTYSVCGHVKTVAIILGGVALFGEDLQPIKAMGVAIALAGVAAYTALRRHQHTALTSDQLIKQGSIQNDTDHIKARQGASLLMPRNAKV